MTALAFVAAQPLKQRCPETLPGKRKRRNFQQQLLARWVKQQEPETAARAGHGEHDGATLGHISCNEQDGADGAQSCREGLAAGNEL